MELLKLATCCAVLGFRVTGYMLPEARPVPPAAFAMPAEPDRAPFYAPKPLPPGPEGIAILRGSYERY
jgi:hypothetical protein